MPYIPMTEPEKRAIVKSKLERLNIDVTNDDTWLDVQILAKQNGLDITQLLKPNVPDHMMMDKNTKDNLQPEEPITEEDFLDKNEKKVTKPKQTIGFGKTPKKQIESKINDESYYQL